MSGKPVVFARSSNGVEIRLWGLYVGKWQAATVWAVSRKQAVQMGRSRVLTPQIPADWRLRLRAKLERK